MKLRHTAKLILLACLVATNALAQTPRVTFRSTRHYAHRVHLFQSLPMITSDDIVMLGNSLTEFGGSWNERIPDAGANIVNRGISGDDAVGMLHRIRQITCGQPKKIFVGCGINDVSHHLTNVEVAQRVEKLLRAIRQQSPKSKVYYFSLFPINESFNRWKTLSGRTNDIPLINKMMRDWCAKNGVTYIDVFSHMTEPGSNVLRKELTVDGLHLTEEGYRVWTAAAKEYF